MLDYCPGGELFFHLSRYKRFPEGVVRYYAAELVLALKVNREEFVAYPGCVISFYSSHAATLFKHTSCHTAMKESHAAARPIVPCSLARERFRREIETRFN